MPRSDRGTTARTTALDPLTVTALYYVASGLWPVVHLRSFMAVTGPKREGWLVQTFGLFVGATGLGLIPRQPALRPAQEQAAIAGALALAAADIYFVVRRRIRPIYLADALVQLALVRWIAGDGRRQEDP